MTEMTEDRVAVKRAAAVSAINVFLDTEKNFSHLAHNAGKGEGQKPVQAEVEARARLAAGEAGKDPDWKPGAKARSKASMAMFTIEGADGRPPALKILVARQDVHDAKEIFEKGREAKFTYAKDGVTSQLDKDGKVVQVAHVKGDKRVASPAARLIANNANALTNKVDGVTGIDALMKGLEGKSAKDRGAPLVNAYIDDVVLRKNAESSKSPEALHTALLAAVDRTRGMTFEIGRNKYLAAQKKEAAKEGAER